MFYAGFSRPSSGLFESKPGKTRLANCYTLFSQDWRRVLACGCPLAQELFFIPTSSRPDCSFTPGCGTWPGLPRPQLSCELHRCHLNAVVGPKAMCQHSFPAPWGPAEETLLPQGAGGKGAGLSLSWGEQNPGPSAMDPKMGVTTSFLPTRNLTEALTTLLPVRNVLQFIRRNPCAFLSCLNTPTLNP